VTVYERSAHGKVCCFMFFVLIPKKSSRKVEEVVSATAVYSKCVCACVRTFCLKVLFHRFVAARFQVAFPKHFTDHRLRRLRQVSTLGKTTGAKNALSVVSFVQF